MNKLKGLALLSERLTYTALMASALRNLKRNLPFKAESVQYVVEELPNDTWQLTITIRTGDSVASYVGDATGDSLSSWISQST